MPKLNASMPWVLWIFAVILIAVGGTLVVGGGRLLLLGGSIYYLVAGILVVASGVLLFRQRWDGARLYGVMLVITLAWAVWEVGVHGWLLAPRIIAPLVLGLGFFIPAVWKPLAGVAEKWSHRNLGITFGALVGAFLIGAGLHAVVGPYTPPDPIYQTGMTTPGEAKPVADIDSRDWRYYGGDAAGTRFTALDQITPENIKNLEVAWTFRAGPDPKGFTAPFEGVPLKVDRTVYVCTDYNDVIALDAETGQQKWRYVSGAYMAMAPYSHCRGVSYYRVPEATGECAKRIITNTMDAKLIALDAETGKLCSGFGEGGVTSLLTGIGKAGDGYYYPTSAPAIVRGKIIVGAMVADGQYWGEPSGVIRAYDAVTGKFVWAFDIGRPDRTTEPPEGETYTRSTPNSWATMSVDENLGLVYAPTGNASGADYYGAQRRPFDDQISSSVVAIDADTGHMRWVFQTTHHDLWDYDVPSQPTLVDIPHPDGTVEHALIQPTKRGEMFLLDRANGNPIATVEERPVPQGGKEVNERLSPTQPFSVGMPSVAGADLTERSMWGITPLDQLWCRIDFRKHRYEGPLTPPGLTPNLFSPSYGGGSNFFGVSIDRDRNIMIAVSNHLATRSQLLTREEATRRGLKALDVGVSIDMGGAVAQEKTPFAVAVGPMMSPLEIPCTSPPFSTLAAVDLTTRKLLWTKPLGLATGSGPLGIKSHLPLVMGVPNWGGVLATRTGISFVAGGTDGYFRAVETATGKEIWHTKTPVPALSIPISYVSEDSGRQFIVVTAGGFRPFKTELGDYVVAYTLPKK